jgi:hypothetical protein
MITSALKHDIIRTQDCRFTHSVVPKQPLLQCHSRLGGSDSSPIPQVAFTTTIICRRHISSTSYRLSEQHDIDLRRKPSKPTPFTVLGVSTEDTYATVKKAFLKIAMTNHPDMHAKKGEAKISEEEQHRMRQVFIEARVAFESLEETPTGHVVIKGETADSKKQEDEDDSFNAWFQQETGHDMPFMDLKTMKEVADMTDDMSVGLDRDGGMWTLAKMVTAAVRQGNQNAAANILQLEAGEIKAGKDGDIDGILRRRRKPNRV